MRDDDETRPYKNKRDLIDWKSVLTWFATATAPIALAAGGWAHGLLWGHDTRLTTLEIQRLSAADQFQEHQAREAKIQQLILESQRRLEDKFDTLRDRIKP